MTDNNNSLLDTTDICSNLVALLVFDHGLILMLTLAKNSFSAAIKFASRTFLLSANIACKHVTMVTNHGYVTRPTSANDNAHNIV